MTERSRSNLLVLAAALAAIATSCFAQDEQQSAAAATSDGTLELYMGQIRIIGEQFCPRGTAEADGRLLAVQSFQALFSLYGTTYGGDGRTTFALPDLRSRRAVGIGAGGGLEQRFLGQKGGREFVTLSTRNLARHSHAVNANNLDGDKAGPGGKILAAAPPNGTGSETIYSDKEPNRLMAEEMLALAGAANPEPIDIRSPFLTLRYCVVLNGMYPSRR